MCLCRGQFAFPNGGLGLLEKGVAVAPSQSWTCSLPVLRFPNASVQYFFFPHKHTRGPSALPRWMPLTKEGSSAPGPPKSHGLPQSSTSDISLLHPPLLSSHLVLSYHFHHDCTPSTQGLSYSTIDRPSSSCLSSLYPSIDGCRQNLSVAQQQPRNAGHARLPVETLLFCALGWKSIVGNSNPSDYCR